MLLVVGGHARNLGKTAVVAGLIRKFRSRRWTAVKITQYGHGVCADGGGKCGCEAAPEHPFALSEEYEPNRTDSGRYLAAGAERSFWLRTRAGELARASATLDKILRRSPNVIVESNSVAELVRPDLFLMLLDFACADFKPSSLRLLDRAVAFLVIDRGINDPLWEHVATGLWDQKTRFLVQPPNYVTQAVSEFVGSRLPAAEG
jgi:molybdopterin-guanine dinucleotide biosynthesis protein